MPYFRADAHLIAKLVKKDCLRYNADNLASIITLFELEARVGKSHFIVVVIYGEEAEDMSRESLVDHWFEIQGQLFDSSPEFEDFSLPKLSIHAKSVMPIPKASSSLLQCQLIGRLTAEPEYISKQGSYDFMRFRVAVNRRNTFQAHYFEFSVFSKNLIEKVSNLAHKGQTVFASGELNLFQKGSTDAVYGAIKLIQIIALEKQSST